MTDTVLGLIPDYGLYVIFAVVTLACLAIPLPAAVLVLTAGSFAAAGDMSVWQVGMVAFAAFIIGDQLAYHIAHFAGRPLLGKLKSNAKMDALIGKSETLLQTKGQSAVFLSHTVISPTCPYVTYLCGAGGMGWMAFSVMAVIGAALWTTAYVSLGYIFANQLTQVIDTLSNFFGLLVAVCLLVASGYWLIRQWRDHNRREAGN